MATLRAWGRMTRPIFCQYESPKKKILHCLVVINPLKYNELIEKMPNLNYLMGWGHARVIENLLEKPLKISISNIFNKASLVACCLCFNIVNISNTKRFGVLPKAKN